MRVLLELVPGIFHPLKNGFILVTQKVPQGSIIELEKKLPLTSMMEISVAHSSGNRVGFFFTSTFEIVNAGGYIVTFLKNKAPADACDTLIKNEHLVVYNYPNRGTLAVSTLVNSDIETIFDEQ